jgi:copper chaperone CopZ
MEQTYTVEGMTCSGCVATVKENLEAIDGVDHAHVSFEKGQVVIDTAKEIPLNKLQSVLGTKYSIYKETPIKNAPPMLENTSEEISKWKQLRPLFLIFGYLFVASFLLNYKPWNIQNAMFDFMGLFYIVFSFFKLLDLKGFPKSFAMYDPLAKRFIAYGWIYPFLELTLGLMFLMRFQVWVALFATLILLGITSFGVTKSLLDKKSIRCACLGTALNLPMTEATFIENAIMIIMAIFMLVN